MTDSGSGHVPGPVPSGGGPAEQPAELKDAMEWHAMVGHLVQAHGAAPALIISCTPTLDQVAFAHFDTHVALELAGLRPPDGHSHPEPLRPGWSEGRPGSYSPFPPSPTAQQNPFFTRPHAFPLPSNTGLPHTGVRPGRYSHDGVAYDLAAQADLADWSSAVRRKCLELNSWRDRPQSPAQVDEALLDYIRQHAVGANARWLAGAGFPGPPQSRSAAETGAAKARGPANSHARQQGAIRRSGRTP
jgi:hypothetical protein